MKKIIYFFRLLVIRHIQSLTFFFKNIGMPMRLLATGSVTLMIGDDLDDDDDVWNNDEDEEEDDDDDDDYGDGNIEK